MEPVHTFLIFVVIIGLSILAVGIASVYWISHEVTRPLRQLSENIENVSLSNLSLQIPNAAGRDEFVQINESFEHMFACLENSMNEVVQLKAHELKAHMLALQSQMDPHFMFNVISVIKAMSHENDNDDIDKVCDYMADTLRYVSSYRDTDVPLGKELENAENYLHLMKYRFEDKLQYTMEIDPTVLFEDAQIPKLSLQPLIENCFQHAFGHQPPPWNITVRGSIHNGMWRISVQDNGEGISPEVVERLYAQADEFIRQPSDRLLTLKVGGMGLVNTLVRLKLRYKDKMIFNIETAPDGGSIITIGGYAE